MARYAEESKARRVPFLGNWAPLEYTTFFNLFFLSFSTTHYLTKRRKGKRENRDISALLRGESQAVYHSRDESAPQDFSVGISPTCRLSTSCPICSILFEEDTSSSADLFPMAVLFVAVIVRENHTRGHPS
jgi:hypothetical protein